MNLVNEFISKDSLTGLNSGFLLLDWLPYTKVKEPSLLYYIAGCIGY